MSGPHAAKTFRRRTERRNKIVQEPFSPTKKDAKPTSCRVIAPLCAKRPTYLSKHLAFATPRRPSSPRAELHVYPQYTRDRHGAVPEGGALRDESRASIIASAIPAASVRGTRPSALADRGVRGLRCHAEGPQVADTVIEAESRIPRRRRSCRYSGTARHDGSRSPAAGYRALVPRCCHIPCHGYENYADAHRSRRTGSAGSYAGVPGWSRCAPAPDAR